MRYPMLPQRAFYVLAAVWLVFFAAGAVVGAVRGDSFQLLSSIAFLVASVVVFGVVNRRYYERS